MLLAIFIGFLITLLLFVLYASHRFILDKQYRLPPGPIPLPLIGSAYHIGDTAKKPWKIFHQLSKVYGPIYTFYFGQMRAIMISGAETTRKVFVKNSKSYSYRADSFMPGYGNAYPFGVISSHGERWARLRRLCTKSLRDFGSGPATLTPRIRDEAFFLLKELEKRSDQQIIEPINEVVANAVANIVCSAILGKRFAYGDSDFLRLIEAAAVFFERPFEENAIYMGVPVLAKFLVAPGANDLIRVDAIINKILQSAIEERRKSFTASTMRDLIDLYLQANEFDSTSLPYDAFLGTMRDMLLAGTETTSSAILWTILYLCKWPEIQRKCQLEIDEVISTDQMPNVEDRLRLVYTDAVMCEILRHVTIVPNALFHATADEVNVLENYEIPPLSAVVYNIWGIHHDCTYWDNPEIFFPERWIHTDGSLLSHSSHFIPFGIGPRACLGESLARLEYFTFTTTLLHRFSFSLPNGYDVNIDSGRYSITHVPPKFKVVVSKR